MIGINFNLANALKFYSVKNDYFVYPFCDLLEVNTYSLESGFPSFFDQVYRMWSSGFLAISLGKVIGLGAGWE